MQLGYHRLVGGEGGGDPESWAPSVALAFVYFALGRFLLLFSHWKRE